VTQAVTGWQPLSENNCLEVTDCDRGDGRAVELLQCLVAVYLNRRQTRTSIDHTGESFSCLIRSTTFSKPVLLELW